MKKSMVITIGSLSCALVLVFISTLAQTQTNILWVEQNILCSFFVWWKGVPVFPGGMTIALVLLFNLGFIISQRRIRRNVALFLIHSGFILLILSEALRLMTSEESFLVLPKGEIVHHTEKGISKERIYFPYGIKLNNFRYEFHPGTDIPKSFASDIAIFDESSNLVREVEISMNNPMTFNGRTYYQETFIAAGETSVLHVVENKWKYLPYLSLAIIATGLTLNLFKVLNRKL